MRILYFFITILLIACASTKSLPIGKWSGYMTPMNHPEMRTPLQYTIAKSGQQMTIVIEGPNDSCIPTSDISMTVDSLFFGFIEPEETVPLTCKMGKTSGKGYQGRCADASGKWASFTMVPPVD